MCCAISDMSCTKMGWQSLTTISNIISASVGCELEAEYVKLEV